MGLQIALAFYLVAFQGFGPSTELAPARDRFAGIMVGLIVMWIVFGEIWPVRSLTVMRGKMASVVRDTATLLTVGDSGQRRDQDLRHADELRDQVRKTVAELRMLNDAAEYEFDSDRHDQIEAAHVILKVAFGSAAMFWNELVFIHNADDEDFLRDSRLLEMRRALAAELNRMAETLTQDGYVSAETPEQFLRSRRSREPA